MTDGEGAYSISARKMAVTLAVLLIRADQVVSVDRLIAEIWDERAPRRANAAVHVYISQLRKFLDTRGAASIIDTVPPGYRLRLGADELDVLDFHRLMDAGRVAAHCERREEAIRHLDAALGLWGGPAFDGLRGGSVIDGYAIWLEESRLECLENLIECKLHVGRHREIVGLLNGLTAEHPLRETFCRQLMLALYRSERQADALRLYHRIRRALADELGLEPGRPLRELYHAILLEDERLEPARLAARPA
ncbi:AfsR/SARP family transcriptional regulator [Pseudofrankia asymbiotica]|jgi:DNA-binding SARP family transcriptional activator|nr:AfsR/SARP family transcriptional regulator [Pseudofrankia asymbiotica]